MVTFCSRSSDYDSKLASLARTLSERADPAHLTKHISYDQSRRADLLQKYSERDRLQASSGTTSINMLVFKCPFGQHLKYLRLKQQYKRLVAYLKPVFGDAFLHDVRFVIAHPVQSNLFLQTLKFNYPPSPPGG